MVDGVDHNVTELQRCIAQGLTNSPQKDATIRNKGGGMCGRPSPVFICYVLTAFFCPRNLLSLLISTSVLSASWFRIPKDYEEKIRKNSLDVLTAFFCRKNLVILLIAVSAGIRRVLISHSKKSYDGEGKKGNSPDVFVGFNKSRWLRLMKNEVLWSLQNPDDILKFSAWNSNVSCLINHTRTRLKHASSLLFVFRVLL